MAKAIAIMGDWTAPKLRQLAAASRHANQSRRLLSLAAVLDGINRTEAASVGGMDRQTLRDWLHRFNDHGLEGLKDDLARPRPRRLTAAQQAELATIVETGPDRAVHGVARWPIGQIWQFLRANFLPNRVFETYEDISDASCNAWNRLVALPQTIKSIGMRECAHLGQP